VSRHSNNRIELIGGPHHGPSNYSDPLPRMLIRMDNDFCYHEYELMPPVNPRKPGIRRYRYRARLGKPRWAYAAEKYACHSAAQGANMTSAPFARPKSGESR
jgi:hypothetical protein